MFLKLCENVIELSLCAMKINKKIIMTIKKTKHSRKKKKKKTQPKKKEKEKSTNINMRVRLTVKLISWYMFFPPNISYQSYDLVFFIL